MSMKAFMKYLLVVAISLIVGGIFGWRAFSNRIKQRIVPFGQRQCREVHVEFIGDKPDIEFHFSPTGNTYVMWGDAGDVEENLNGRLEKAASFSTSYWFSVSFNRDVTVQQVRDIDERIRRFGFPSPLMLIEENRETRTGEEERVFREIRIGSSMDFD